MQIVLTRWFAGSFERVSPARAPAPTVRVECEPWQCRSQRAVPVHGKLRAQPMAECALNRRGEGRFRAFSAGSHPTGAPHPRALALLRALHYDVAELRSKSWSECAAPGAPEMHFVITVCDDARGESCPVWPGRPLRAHWGVADPAAATGPAEVVERAFQRRLPGARSADRAVHEPSDRRLDRLALQERLEAIGKARCRTRADRALRAGPSRSLTARAPAFARLRLAARRPTSSASASPDCSHKRPAAFTQAPSRFDCVTKRESPSVKRSWRPKWSWS